MRKLLNNIIVYINFIFNYNNFNYNDLINNIDYIDSMNNLNYSFNLEINKFAQLNNYNFKNFSKTNFIKSSSSCDKFDYKIDKDINIENFDWRNSSYNILTPIKNQKKCGSCWAFASVETAESNFAINNNNKLYTFSPQELVDCVYENNGCDGGNIESALVYIINNGWRWINAVSCIWQWFNKGTIRSIFEKM